MLGFGAHPFGHLERLVQKLVEHRSGGAVLGGLAEGVFYLSQDLGLAHHQGIQAGGHPEQMPYRLPPLVGVETSFYLSGRKAAPLAEPAAQVLRALLRVALGHGQKLHPVAGGHQKRLAHAVQGQGFGQHVAGVVLLRGQALAHLYRGGVVIESHQDEVHFGTPPASPRLTKLW